jgi:hypothetical protein
MSENGELEKDNSSFWKGSQLDSLEALSESLLRLCLAGAGGALVGLSFRHSRRRLYDPVSSTTMIHANQLYSYYENAPYTFAIRFAAFVGILEFHRLCSPTQMMLSWNFHPTRYLHDVLTAINISSIDLESTLQQHRAEHSTNNDLSTWIPSKATITIFDYAMGGFVAGGIFSRFPNVTSFTESGSPPQSSTFRKKWTDNEAISIKQKKLIGKGRRLILPSPKPTIAPMSNPTSSPIVIYKEGYPSPLHVKHSFHFRHALLRGALPGLFLGFLAGLLQFSLDQLLVSLQKMEQEHTTLPTTDDENNIEDANDNSDIKSMTLDELKREIEILKNRKS